MYRKFLSAILFGALTIASTSTFVSCKDYDDDIDALNARVDANDADNKALHDALDAANQELTNLKAQLASEVARLDGLVAAAQGTADQAIKDAAAAQATADQAVKDAAAAQATADQALKLSQENKEAIANEIIRATAAEEALRVRIQTLEEVVIPELRQLIKDLDDKKLDKKTFNEEVAKIYTRLEAVETGLGKALERIETLEKGLADEILARKALAEDLEQQKKIIANHETRLKELEEKVVPELRQLIQKLREDYEADVKRIDEAISKLAERVTKNENDIKDLKEDVRKINEELEKINNKLNELNVLILRSLRSLVFIPDFYYWGIEATELSGVYYKYWLITDMPKVNADDNDPTWNLLKNGKLACFENPTLSKQKEDFLVENFVARYHLNPSSADLSALTVDNFAVLSGDREYRTKAVAQDKKNSNITVASFDPKADVKNGDLYLNLNIADPVKIKKIGHIEDGTFVQDPEETGMVTVFATEITLNDEMKNTVTSDYAALLATTYANGYRLAHTNAGDPAVKVAGLTSSYTKVVNPSNCGTCAVNLANRHLFTDADETVWGGGDNAPLTIVKLKDQPLVSALNGDLSTTTAQDVVEWNKTIDLSKLAEVHRIGDQNVAEKVMTAAELEKNGFEIRFELTGMQMKDNATSESAHAAIAEDGKTLRPQLPAMGYDEQGHSKGLAAKYGATKQDKTTIGRTPLVRVMLVDTKHNDHVLDYGYIRLVIVDNDPEAQEEPIEGFRTVEYNTANSLDYTYNECAAQPTPEKWSWRQTWASFENDLYNMYNLSQRDFEDRYEAVIKDVEGGKYCTAGLEDALKQYKMVIKNGKDTTFVACTADEYLGDITVKAGSLIGEGTKTQVLDWQVSGEQLKAYALDGKKETTRVVKYQLINAADRSKYMDVYVILKAGEIKVTKETVKYPTVTGKFDANKIKEYWYDENTQKAQNTLHEAHLNVPSPEDWIKTWGESRTCPFEFLLSSDFDNNFILNENKLDQYITVDDPTTNKLWALSKAEKTFGFVVLTADKDGYKANNKAKGYSGTTYTLSVGDYRQVPAWGLYATANGKKELIAYLEYDESDEQNINHVKIVLNKAAHRADHINSFVEDIINYKAHNDLTDDFLKVLLGINLKWAAPQGMDAKCGYETTIPAFQVRFLRPINMFEEGLQVQDAANSTQIFPLYDLVHFTDWREQWNPIAGTDKTINKERRDRVVPDGGKYIVDYWYYYNIKHIIIGNATEIVDPAQETALNNIMHTNMNGNDITKTILARVSNNVEFTYVPADPTTSASAEIGDPAFYGSIKYTNNRSTVDQFDVTVPITVCYEWGHLYKEVTIHVVKTLENTTVKARR